jgi:23S rRNA pseudouridine1911/1915/1917 synthase
MNHYEHQQRQRLDQQIVEQFPEFSRSFATRLIEDEKVTVNGKVIIKAGFKLNPEDVVVVDYNSKETTQIPDIEIPILYEDDDCVVINKPVGLLTHSKGAFNPEATVATWLSARTKNMDGERAGIVHRLDRATGGVMICAKTPEALSWLQKQFAQRRTKKTYNAIIEGTLNPDKALIDMPIERNPKKPQTFRVGNNGKPSKTQYEVIESGPKYSLVELKPETGRTHQLRVHLRQFEHPIVGDTFYEGKPAERLFLHALSLELTLPNRSREVFTTELPKEFMDKLHALK